jgi:hypothetical protein
MSMLTGAFSGIGVGVYSVLFNPNFAWYPIIICLLTSSIIYTIGVLNEYKNRG